ncbi:MAG: CBS domain-containing protein [Myxococcaceae bacterium]
MALLSLKVSDLMTTALLTVKEREPIGMVETSMKLGQIRHVPVVDDHGHLVGILSARDVLAAMAQGKSSTPAAEYMQRNVITVGPDTPAREAIDLLVDNRLGALPVVGSQGELVGIITETDFLLASRDLFGRPRVHGG